jgi:hypothetical protein
MARSEGREQGDGETRKQEVGKRGIEERLGQGI